MYVSLLRPQLISSLAIKAHSAALATGEVGGGRYGCRWFSVAITTYDKWKAKDRGLLPGRGAPWAEEGQTQVRSGPALSEKQPKNPCNSQVLDPGDCHLGLTAPESAKQIVPN